MDREFENIEMHTEFIPLYPKKLPISKYHNPSRGLYVHDPEAIGLLIGWKIYYGDGTVVSSKEKRWADAPSGAEVGGVQIIIFYHQNIGPIKPGKRIRPLRTIVRGSDIYYRYDNGDKVIYGDVVEVGKSADIARGDIKLGMWCEDYHKIYQKALEDYYL